MSRRHSMSYGTPSGGMSSTRKESSVGVGLESILGGVAGVFGRSQSEEPITSAIPDMVLHKNRLMRRATYVDLKPHLDAMSRLSTESDRRRRRLCEDVKSKRWR